MKTPVLLLLIAALALLAAGCVQQQQPPAASPTATPTLQPCVFNSARGSCCRGSDCSTAQPNCVEGAVPKSIGCSADCVLVTECIATPTPSALPTPKPSAVPSASPSVPSIGELAQRIEPIASSVLGFNVKIPKINDNQYITADSTHPVNYFISVENSLFNAFDSADFLAELSGTKTNATKTVALNYLKLSNAYFDYDVKQFCFGKRFIVTTKVREPIYSSTPIKNYGEKLARAVIDVCPE